MASMRLKIVTVTNMSKMGLSIVAIPSNSKKMKFFLCKHFLVHSSAHPIHSISRPDCSEECLHGPGSIPLYWSADSAVKVIIFTQSGLNDLVIRIKW